MRWLYDYCNCNIGNCNNRTVTKLFDKIAKLHNTLGNQQAISLDGLKTYKLHGREVVRLEDLLKRVEV